MSVPSGQIPLEESRTIDMALWVVAASIGAIVPGVGPLSDTVGRKRVLIPSLLMMATGLLTCLLSPNVWIPLVARVVQGC